MADYDTEEGIAQYLERGIAGFHELIQARHEAGYARKERMEQFLVLGRWMLDRCGNLGEVERLRDTTTQQDLLGKIAFARVANLEALKLIPNLSVTSAMTGNLAIPKPDSRCWICDRGWTLENLHDHIAIRTEKESAPFDVRHKACHKFQRGIELRNNFRAIFEHHFGEDTFLLNTIPNEYCQCEVCGPWFVAETPWGKFKVGWRKSVILLDWSDTGFDGAKLFEDQDVTRGNGYIHAYGYENLKKYLTRLYDAVVENKHDPAP